MTIDKSLETQILRFHLVEHWGVHTIAAQLGIHHSVVDRVLSQAGMPKAQRALMPSKLDPYLPFVLQTLEKYPKLTAARLYVMACERGYTGGPSHFRARVAELRPRPAAEAYLRLRTLPGEEAQMDWGSFSSITVGRAERPLMAFVMVLSYSRQIFLRFYLNQRMESFLQGHVSAFNAFNGVSRVVLYDNLRSAVLERHGSAIHFNPKLLDLAAHYHFEPRPVAVARGNQKGRVERAIRFIRDNFFAARQWRDLDDLNTQASHWCSGQSASRACPEDNRMTVAEAFAEEQGQLIPLPDNPYPGEDQTSVSVGKTPYVRFDLNDYSIPHTYVRRMVTVMASPTRVRVIDAMTEIASHLRCYDKAQQIEDPAHLAALREYKANARHHSNQDRLSHAVPAAIELISAANARGHRPSSVVKRLIELLAQYGAEELNAGIEQALAQSSAHPEAVAQILDQRREARDVAPPIAVSLPDNPDVQNARVRLASLSVYDQINPPTERTEPENANKGHEVGNSPEPENSPERENSTESKDSPEGHKENHHDSINTDDIQ